MRFLYDMLEVGDKKAGQIIEDYKDFISELSENLNEEKSVKFRKMLSGKLPIQITAMKKLFQSLREFSVGR